MAHEIDFSLGRPAIAYTGEKPWHGYGEEMPEDASLEKWRVLAGLDWGVDERAIYTWPAPHSLYETHARIEVPNRKALIRNDTNSVLSVVSDRYNVVQPQEVIEFFRDLIEKQGFKMHTAGSLRDGKRIWALAETGQEMNVKGDKLGAYLLLATSYDGTFATTAQFTSIRVVCNNTLSWSLNSESGAGVIKIPHSQDFNEVDVKVNLGLAEDWAQFRDNVISLSEVKVTKRQAIEYFLSVMGVTEDEVVEGKQLSNVKKLLHFYESAPGADMATAKDTAWGLVNAVTYFTDHGRRARDNGTRFDSAAFGAGAVLKRKAYSSALELAA